MIIPNIFSLWSTHLSITRSKNHTKLRRGFWYGGPVPEKSGCCAVYLKNTKLAVMRFCRQRNLWNRVMSQLIDLLSTNKIGCPLACLFIHLFVRSFIRSLVRWFVGLLVGWLVGWLVGSFIRSFVCSFSNWITVSLLFQMKKSCWYNKLLQLKKKFQVKYSSLSYSWFIVVNLATLHILYVFK